jgi:hypothetical protein
VKIENFEKNIHGRAKFLGWFKKQHGRKLLADSKNVHILYVYKTMFGLLECNWGVRYLLSD